MRTYPTDSPAAAGRLLALTMIADGNVAASEFKAVHGSRILEHVAMMVDEFDMVFHDLCNDLLLMSHHGSVRIDVELIDHLLDEIHEPGLRRKMLQAM